MWTTHMLAITFSRPGLLQKLLFLPRKVSVYLLQTLGCGVVSFQCLKYWTRPSDLNVSTGNQTLNQSEYSLKTIFS